MAYYSKIPNFIENNYIVYNHKMLDIIQSCSKWICYLINCHIVVCIDHKPLEQF